MTLNTREHSLSKIENTDWNAKREGTCNAQKRETESANARQLCKITSLEYARVSYLFTQRLPDVPLPFCRLCGRYQLSGINLYASFTAESVTKQIYHV